MFKFGKSIIAGIRRTFSRSKPKFSRENINRYIPEQLKKQIRPQKKGISKKLISAITLGIGVVGVLAGIGVSKLVRDRRIKKAVVLVGTGGARLNMGANAFNGYLLKYTDISCLDAMADTLAVNNFTELIIVPMTVINGYETEQIKSIMAYKRECFDKITYAPALLTSDADYEYVAKTLAACVRGYDEDTAVVFVARGTTHYANSSYIALNERFRRIGCYNLFAATMTSYPDFEKIMGDIGASHYQNVILCPLEMTVDADLRAELAEGENSWFEKFSNVGFNCGYYLKGLCAYRGIRHLIIEHTKSVM